MPSTLSGCRSPTSRGPYGTLMLAVFRAALIKTPPQGGDDTRQWDPVGARILFPSAGI